MNTTETQLPSKRAVSASVLLDTDEREAIALRNGYRPKTYGDRMATYAICKHGVIVPADIDSHTCSWMLLVRPMQESAMPGR